METSCEGSVHICRAMNLPVSGDSVIRLLTRRYRLQPVTECGSVIGIDDFAFKKRHTYGTIIVDQAAHKPVAIPDGRDGMTLREWLKNNKHIKAVTRDRASAYSSAIQEVLPDAMQTADRFHLHQNLLEAVKNTVNSVIPADTRIPIDYGKKETSADTGEACKKMHCNVDNLLDYNEKSVQLYNAIHEYSEAGYSKREISRMLHCSRNNWPQSLYCQMDNTDNCVRTLEPQNTQLYYALFYSTYVGILFLSSKIFSVRLTFVQIEGTMYM